MSALVLSTILVGLAQATEMRYATGYPPNSIGSMAADRYAEALTEHSGGELTAKVYPLTLLNFMEMSDGLRDGMADAGAVLLTYAPTEYPRANLIGESSMLLELTDIEHHRAGMAFGGAMAEYMFNHCPSCLDEFESQNQVYAGAGASTRYMLLCNEPVTSVADLQGKRLRHGGANWSRWAEAMEASPVSMSVNEMYEGISQGVLDCTIQSTPELTIFKMMEVVSDITTAVPGGVYGTSSNSINRDFWQSLNHDQREAVMYATAVTSADITWAYAQASLDNLQTARERDDIVVHEPDDDLVATTEDFVHRDLEQIARIYRERHGISNGDQMLDDFRPILEKWAGLVADIDSADALTELYWNQVYSKVDVTSHGL
ncbi:C4-dicarboxylate TRAP transporter substrate-binding protein [Alcanivorax sp. ZXX171]|nr:C4-dicarboxylate TRAP transporter substrate-binding protein [Alcanivorax sp. ZXX171]